MNELILILFWLFFGGGFILAGWLSLYKRDLLWSWTETRLLRHGIKPERTHDWDQHQRRLGIVSLIGGVVLFSCVCPFVLFVVINSG